MLPIGDDNTGHRLTPFVNYILIAINVLVFVFLQGGGSDLQFLYAYSTVPAEILEGKDLEVGPLEPTPIPVYGTLITSMFMHGGWMHLLGNMLFLWVFGDNIENRLGHAKYLGFYLLCGIIASLSHVFARCDLHGSLVWFNFATEYFKKCTFTSTIGTDNSITISLGEIEVDFFKQNPLPVSQFQILYADHLLFNLRRQRYGITAFFEGGRSRKNHKMPTIPYMARDQRVLSTIIQL